MKVITLSKLRFSSGDTDSGPGPIIVPEPVPGATDRRTWIIRLAEWRIFGRSPAGVYLRLNYRLWHNLPEYFISSAPMRWYGRFLHTLVRTQSVRGQLFHTFFLRNRPALELIRRLVEQKPHGALLRVAVLGCSTGAEAYSIAWKIRSARPDLRLALHAIDISAEAVEIAKSGIYSSAVCEFVGTNFLDRMTSVEIDELFDKDRDVVTVKSWIRNGVNWHVGDVARPEILETFGPQDIVLANNFLCHMDAPQAEKCLHLIAGLVSPYGYLFVSGIDLDIRTKVACDLRWLPVQELLEEIHEGDPRMRLNWPWNYSALEPLNKRRRDWRFRYASAFQLVPGAEPRSGFL